VEALPEHAPAGLVGLGEGDGSGRDGRLRGEDRDLSGLGKHHAQNLLQGQDVNAGVPALEEVAGAVPGFAVERTV
jgi:hypothetical protein